MEEEKSFEKFPSLKNKLFRNKNMDMDYFMGDEEEYDGHFNNYWYTERDVKEHCRDNQKIKEAISECTLTGYRGNPEGYINAENLLRRLRLKE
jgi:hypothetical protein